jgi:hypothetical protein
MILHRTVSLGQAKIKLYNTKSRIQDRMDMKLMVMLLLFSFPSSSLRKLRQGSTTALS